MNNTEQAKLDNWRRRIFLRIKFGCIFLKQNKKLFVLLIPIMLAIILANISYYMHNTGEFIDKLTHVSNVIALLVFIPVIDVLILYLRGTPFKARYYENHLKEAGIVNSIGIPMMLISKSYNPITELDDWKFDLQNIPFENLNDNWEKIETALNVSIFDIKLIDNRQTVIISTKKATMDDRDIIPWSIYYMSNKESEFVIGEGIHGKEVIDIDKTPHLLLGGSTGSGKTILLKLILVQALLKGVQVSIYDFKGGVDFTGYWDRRANLYHNYDDVISDLSSSCDELYKRQILFKKEGCSNIDEYNTTHETKIKRIIIACDEIGEMLDKTGLSKDQKEKVIQIEGYISTIARLGRAFGIHLILATQRPDANILNGQIKNNLDYRVCGRSDSVLSTIILDNGDASKKLNKQARGAFLNNQGRIFQAYFMNKNMEQNILKDCVYEKE